MANGEGNGNGAKWRDWVIYFLAALLLAGFGKYVGNLGVEADLQQLQQRVAQQQERVSDVAIRSEVHQKEADRRLASIEGKLDELLRRSGP